MDTGTSRPGYSRLAQKWRRNVVVPRGAVLLSLTFGALVVAPACTSETEPEGGPQPVTVADAGHVQAHTLKSLLVHPPLDAEAAMTSVMARLEKRSAVCVQFKSVADKAVADAMRSEIETKHNIPVEVTAVDIVRRGKRRGKKRAAATVQTWHRLCAGTLPSAREARATADTWTTDGGALTPYLDEVKKGQAAYLLKSIITTAEGRPSVKQAQLASRIAHDGETTLLSGPTGVVLAVNQGERLVFIPPDVKSAQPLVALDGYAACAVCARALTTRTKIETVLNADFMDAPGAELLVVEHGMDDEGHNVSVWSVVSVSPNPRVLMREVRRLELSGYETIRELIVVPSAKRAMLIKKTERGPLATDAPCAQRVILETLSPQAKITALTLSDLTDRAVRDAAIAADAGTVLATVETALLNVEAGGAPAPLLQIVRAVLDSATTDSDAAVRLSALAQLMLFDVGETMQKRWRVRFVEEAIAVNKKPLQSGAACRSEAGAGTVNTGALTAAVFAARDVLGKGRTDKNTKRAIRIIDNQLRDFITSAAPERRKKIDADKAVLTARARLR